MLSARPPTNFLYSVPPPRPCGLHGYFNRLLSGLNFGFEDLQRLANQRVTLEFLHGITWRLRLVPRRRRRDHEPFTLDELRHELAAGNATEQLLEEFAVVRTLECLGRHELLRRIA